MGLGLEAYQNLISLQPYARPEPFSTAEEKERAAEKLLKFLLRERGLIAAFSATYERKRRLVREYMNERNPLPAPKELLDLQDRLFWTESLERGIVDVASFPEYKYNLSLWEGDITRLNADAIVNAANNTLLGCFMAGHACIDNVIHSYAGMQLRADCARIMAEQGTKEACGEAKITSAYNLPSKYVIHTVGPMVGRSVKEEEQAQLRSCYTACLNLADKMGLGSISFCCISTGVFNFPKDEAAELAIGAVVNWKLKNPSNQMKIIFDTFLPDDTKRYENILKML